MTINWTIPLAIAFAAIAIINTALQAWLWTFPMAADPTGREEHGVTTAPRFWRAVHRGLGYVFVLIYLAIMFEMIPRAWRYQEGWNARVIAHALMGLLVGPILLTKILIVRRLHRFGHRLPWFGGTLCGLTVVLVVIVMVPAWRLWAKPSTMQSAPTMSDGQPFTRTLPDGRWVAINKCLQCHGPGTVLEKRRDMEDWLEIAAEMQDHAAGTPGAIPITPEDRAAVAAYLNAIYGKENGDKEANRKRS